MLCCKKFISVGFLVAINSLQAQTLPEVVDLALRHNNQLKSAEWSLKANEQDIGITRAQILPSLTLHGGTDWNDSTDQKDSPLETQQNYNKHSYGATFSLPLFDLGAYFDIAASKSSYKERSLEYRQTEQQIIFNVVASYIESLKLQSQLLTTKNELETAQQRMIQVKRNIELGNTSGSELYEAQAQFSLVKNDIFSLESSFRQTQLRLNQLAQNNVNVKQDINIDVDFKKFTPTSINNMRNKLIGDNIDIAYSEQQQKTKSNQLKAAKSANSPVFYASADYLNEDSNQDHSSLRTGLSDSWIYSLNVRIPIVQGGQTFHSLKKKNFELGQANIDVTEAKSFTVSEFNILIEKIHNLIDSAKLLKEVTSVNQRSFDGINKAYQLGTRTMTDVLASETRLYKSIRQYQEVKFNLIIELTRLAQIMGDLNLNRVEELHRNLSSTNNMNEAVYE